MLFTKEASNEGVELEKGFEAFIFTFYKEGRDIESTKTAIRNDRWQN
jgi:hypothetical protein